MSCLSDELSRVGEGHRLLQFRGRSRKRLVVRRIVVTERATAPFGCPIPDGTGCAPVAVVVAEPVP
jgi:hypothetical protein